MLLDSANAERPATGCRSGREDLSKRSTFDVENRISGANQLKLESPSDPRFGLVFKDLYFEIQIVFPVFPDPVSETFVV